MKDDYQIQQAKRATRKRKKKQANIEQRKLKPSRQAADHLILIYPGTFSVERSLLDRLLEQRACSLVVLTIYLLRMIMIYLFSLVCRNDFVCLGALLLMIYHSPNRFVFLSAVGSNLLLTFLSVLGLIGSPHLCDLLLSAPT